LVAGAVVVAETEEVVAEQVEYYVMLLQLNLQVIL
jgi:hypothetical protein